MKRDAEMADADVTFGWMVENIPWMIGSPEECRAQIHEMHDDLGGFGTLLINSRDHRGFRPAPTVSKVEV